MENRALENHSNIVQTEGNLIERERTEKMLKKYMGSLVGVAVADALGAPSEFLSQQDISRKFGSVTEYTGGGIFNWAPGEVTDDTDQTMVVVDSIIKNRGFVPEDIANGLLEWYKKRPKDIGTTTKASLQHLNNGLEWKEAGKRTLNDHNSASNGSLMRTAPIGLLFDGDDDKLSDAAEELSIITHAHPDSIASCKIASQFVSLLLNNPKEEALGKLREKFPGKLDTILDTKYDPLADQSLALNTLQVAINSFMAAENFVEAVISSIHHGGDTDTQAAVTGAFAGAFWGIDAIPKNLRDGLNPISGFEIAEKGKILYYIAHPVVNNESLQVLGDLTELSKSGEIFSSESILLHVVESGKVDDPKLIIGSAKEFVTGFDYLQKSGVKSEVLERIALRAQIYQLFFKDILPLELQSKISAILEKVEDSTPVANEMIKYVQDSDASLEEFMHDQVDTFQISPKPFQKPFRLANLILNLWVAKKAESLLNAANNTHAITPTTLELYEDPGTLMQGIRLHKSTNRRLN